MRQSRTTHPEKHIYSRQSSLREFEKKQNEDKNWMGSEVEVNMERF